MVTGPISVSRQLGDLISEVILYFARKRGWGPESYDLWYRDEPVWFLRQSSEVTRRGGGCPSRMTLVRRVQVAAFDTLRGVELHAMPDAYLYNPVTKNVEAQVPPNNRVNGTKTAKLGKLERLLFTNDQNDQDQVKGILRTLIEDAWKEASKLEIT